MNFFEGTIYPLPSTSISLKLLSSANKPHPSNLSEGLFKSSSFLTFHIFFAKLLHTLIVLSSVLYFASFAEHPKHNKSSNSGYILKQSSGI